VLCKVNGLVIAFGGVDRDQIHHNDAIIFSSITQKWMKADQKGTFGDVNYLILLMKELIRSQLASSLYIYRMISGRTESGVR
jgi:hypothetical protein